MCLSDHSVFLHRCRLCVPTTPSHQDHLVVCTHVPFRLRLEKAGQGRRRENARSDLASQAFLLGLSEYCSSPWAAHQQLFLQLRALVAVFWSVSVSQSDISEEGLRGFASASAFPGLPFAALCRQSVACLKTREAA